MTNTSTADTSSGSTRQTMATHLAELRRRFAWVAGAFLLGTLAAYQFQKEIVSWILAPLRGQDLIYLTPGGGFNFIFMVSIYTGFVVAVPVTIYHLYRFLAPIMPEHARVRSAGIVLSSVALFAIAFCFSYFVAIPAALQFLAGFGADYVQSTLTADSYLSFVLAYLLGLGLLFQLPLVLVLWNMISQIKPGGLLKSQGYVIAAVFIIAAIITPTPDALNQCLVAGPVLLCYEIGVVAVWLVNRRGRLRA